MSKCISKLTSEHCGISLRVVLFQIFLFVDAANRSVFLRVLRDLKKEKIVVCI